MNTSEPTEVPSLLVRKGRLTDLPFVYANWLRELRHADNSPLADDLFFGAHRAHLNRVLSDPKVVLLVACPSDDEDQILGFVVAEPEEILHWIQIKPRFREKYGLCRTLLEAAKVTDAPASWTTRDSARLRNPRRSRQQRKRYPGSPGEARP